MMRRTGLVGAVMAASLAFAAHAGVPEGVAAWQNGDYARAIAEWQPLADAGDADAQFNLGQAYKLGRGVPQDMERALDLFGSAARSGHLQAEANYGLIQFQNGNREEAMPYIISAAERGEVRAQYIYGTALFNGDLAPRDWPRAYAMMTNAAAAGLPQATASIEQMNEYIPLEQRQEGERMAERFAGTQVAAASPPPSAAPVPAPVAAPPPQPAPQTYPQSDPRPQPAPPVRQPAPVVAETPAPAPTPAPAARSGNWRVQLGSFRQRSNAESHWRNLSARVSQIAALQPYLVTAGPYTRLQAGPFATRSEANSMCSVARSAGSDCIATQR